MRKFVFLFLLLSQVDSDPLVVQPGNQAFLSCQADTFPVIAVEWTTTNLTHPQYVLFFSDGHADKTHQYPSFEGRVYLVDKEMNNGNVSIIIKNVTSSDSGIYECRVSSGGSRPKRANINNNPITSITLQVKDVDDSGNPTDKGKTHGDLNHEMNTFHVHNHTGLVVGISAFVLLGIGFSGIKYKVKKNQNSDLSTFETDRQLI
ncbi:hypothetical protein Q5P01_000023 [Channa striata]|uniref:Ig-like domain-containing protein n=1 Tax=Channa striata TaxID=64152 RepID=A0AA88LMU9_CHASR|nr:hypothetical protein Q5P01_000023 [Channa striata]